MSKTYCLFVLGFVILLGLPAMAQKQVGQAEYILTTSPSSVDSLDHRHGLNFKSTVWHNSNYGYGVYVVTDPSSRDSVQLQSELKSDPATMAFELNQVVQLPELSGTTSAALAQSTDSILDSLPGRTLVTFSGATVPSNYVQQPATTIIRWQEALQRSGLTGAGTVAVIDTGVDSNHPALTRVLVPGFDFTRNQNGASELADLDPSVAASLSQSTDSILDSNNVFQLSSSTLAILTQSTDSILDGTPAAFGHGTMTAGLVHLIAPSTKIMPLKAFNINGTSDTANIVRAIYYAVDHGANIINMSFEIAESSPGLQGALDYATDHGVVAIAAAGNDGQQTTVFPAGSEGVIGIGSTTNNDQKSTFSNYGSPDVNFAAPGEGVISTYPGNHYAAGWGTSFSAPIVAGAAALVLQNHPTNLQCAVMKALTHAVQVPLMGYGRIDLYQALTARDTIPGFTDPSCEAGREDGGHRRPD
ncbi:MAG TPA: S8 family serine peptidase [Candidatus Angelobacter sp.]|jgi:subtilisin family serine protease|nr:S8 family serine peptidase [Candidatus Angelobacter sp.]